MNQLKLIALDKDDLEIISAHLQDAVLKVGDILWRPGERRLVLALSRFDWDSVNEARSEFRRCLTALRFERVNAFKARNIGAGDKDTVLNLLAVEFAENDPPGGIVELVFSGGAAMRLEVECLEVEVTDLGLAWPTAARPRHSDDEPSTPGESRRS